MNRTLRQCPLPEKTASEPEAARRTKTQPAFLLQSVVIPAVAVLLLLSPGCEDPGGDQDAPTTRPAENATAADDAAYASALRAANDFCRAWQMRDYRTGRAMLTVRLQRKYPEDDLRAAIAGQTNPRHEAYEVSAGNRLGEGRYAFRLRLFLLYSGERDIRVESPVERIVLMKDKSGQWRVDEFPMLK